MTTLLLLVYDARTCLDLSVKMQARPDPDRLTHIAQVGCIGSTAYVLPCNPCLIHVEYSQLQNPTGCETVKINRTVKHYYRSQ